MTVTYIYNDAGGNYLGTITRNINDKPARKHLARPPASQIRGLFMV